MQKWPSAIPRQKHSSARQAGSDLSFLACTHRRLGRREALLELNSRTCGCSCSSTGVVILYSLVAHNARTSGQLQKLERRPEGCADRHTHSKHNDMPFHKAVTYPATSSTIPARRSSASQEEHTFSAQQAGSRLLVSARPQSGLHLHKALLELQVRTFRSGCGGTSLARLGRLQD